jgi:hypothetical protein
MAIDAAFLQAANSRLVEEKRRLGAENVQLHKTVAQLEAKVAALTQVVERQQQQIETLLGEVQVLKRANGLLAEALQQAEAERESAVERAQQLAQDNERLQAALGKAEKRIEELERTTARQAAPFRRPEKVANPKPQGRKKGHPGARRRQPRQIDHDIEVPLEACPKCHCPLDERRPLTQYIEEIPLLRPVVTRLTTWQATCPCCGEEVQSTHPLQVSFAQGAAGVHLGPRATALATVLKTHFGLPMRKTCAILQQGFGLSLTAGGLAQLLHRVAGKATPQHVELLEQIRTSAAVHADETSWYVNGKSWLWVFTTLDHTLYHVDQSRGRPVAESILGSNFAGVLITDCAPIYDSLPCPQHKCIAHHLRKLKELRLRQDTPDPTYLNAWEAFWKEVVELTKGRADMSPEAFAQRREELRHRMKVLIAKYLTQPGDFKFRTRMLNAEPHLLGCLDHDVEPTNNRAERAIRPAVIARKLSCGNKTPRGATTWEILASRCATLYQQGQDLLDHFTLLVHANPLPAG